MHLRNVLSPRKIVTSESSYFGQTIGSYLLLFCNFLMTARLTDMLYGLFRFEESVPMSGLWQGFMFESEFETTRC